jgi:hypothetical protein
MIDLTMSADQTTILKTTLATHKERNKIQLLQNHSNKQNLVIHDNMHQHYAKNNITETDSDFQQTFQQSICNYSATTDATQHQFHFKQHKVS